VEEDAGWAKGAWGRGREREREKLFSAADVIAKRACTTRTHV